MPEATLRAVADHGRVPADSIHDHHHDAQQVLDRMRALGIDYDTVVDTLEVDGLAVFDNSWDQLGDTLTATLRTRPSQHLNP